MTTSLAFCTDASAVFNAITGYSDPPHLSKLVMAPSGLRRRFLIDRPASSVAVLPVAVCIAARRRSNDQASSRSPHSGASVATAPKVAASATLCPVGVLVCGVLVCGVLVCAAAAATHA